MVKFSENKVKTMVMLFNQQHIKYHNKFFKSLINKLKIKQSLSDKQYRQLNYLLKNGRTMYEDGILTTKN